MRKFASPEHFTKVFVTEMFCKTFSGSRFRAAPLQNEIAPKSNPSSCSFYSKTKLGTKNPKHAPKCSRKTLKPCAAA